MTTLRGRERELAALRQVLSDAAAGRSRVVFVEGEPGIGKTRLLEEVVAAARAQAIQVFEGRCDDVGTSRPFGAITQALGVTDDATDPERANITRLLRGDGATAADVPGAEFRVVEALGSIVERLAASGSLLLAIEDLHWADPSTLIALRSIVQRSDRLPVAILGTSRPGHGLTTLHRVMDDALRAGATRLVLGPLAPEDIASLVADLVGGDPSPALLVRVGGATGNPLFVTEYVRAVADDTSGEVVPVEFRLTVLRRLTHLDEQANAVLRIAAVLGATFAPSDVAIVLGLSATDLMTPLQQGVDAGIVQARDERLAFRHDLVREAIYEHIPLAVRKQLHRDVGRALAGAGGDPLVVAHHLALGADGPDAEAASWLRRAAADAMRRSPTVAAQLLERTMALTERPDAELRAELVMALAWAGRLAEAEALAREVLDLEPEPAVAGPLRCGLVYALTWQGRPREALRHASTEGLSDEDAALLDAEAAMASLLALDLRDAAMRAGPALEAAQRVGHDLAICHALSVQAWVATFTGRPHGALEIVQQAIAVAERSPDRSPYLAHPRVWSGMPLVILDRLDEAEEMLLAGRRRAEEMGLVWSLPLYHAYGGINRSVKGDWDGAMAEFEACLALADEYGLHMVGIIAGAAWSTVVQLHRDDLEGAEQTVADAMRRLTAAEAPAFGLLGWARALLAEARGDLDEALALLQPAWDAFNQAGNVTEPWSGMALVRLLIATGDRARAATLVPFMEQQASLVGTPFTRGQALRCRGLVDADPDVLVLALESYRACPRRPELAAACEDAGTHLARAGRVNEGVVLLDEALGIYDDIGAVRDIRRIRAALRSHGAKRGARGRRNRPTTGWESLTPTEREVVGLVAQRLSNPEVSERLFISRHTVESHLKHVYRKLGVSSRVELATQAARRGGLAR